MCATAPPLLEQLCKHEYCGHQRPHTSSLYLYHELCQVAGPHELAVSTRRDATVVHGRYAEQPHGGRTVNGGAEREHQGADNTQILSVKVTVGARPSFLVRTVLD